MAVGAFKAFGKGAGPIVAGLLDDPDRSVRLEAARILKQIADRGVLPALQKAYEKYALWSQDTTAAGISTDPESAFVRDIATSALPWLG